MTLQIQCCLIPRLKTAMVSIWLSLGRCRPTTQPPCCGIDKKLPASVSADASSWDPFNQSPSTTKHTRGNALSYFRLPLQLIVWTRDMSPFPLPKLKIHGGHNHYSQMKSLSFGLVCYTAINNWNTASESPGQDCPPLPSYLITPWLQLQPVNYYLLPSALSQLPGKQEALNGYL